MSWLFSASVGRDPRRGRRVVLFEGLEGITDRGDEGGEGLLLATIHPSALSPAPAPATGAGV